MAADHGGERTDLGGEIAVDGEGSGEVHRKDSSGPVGDQQLGPGECDEKQGDAGVEIEEAAVGGDLLTHAFLDVADRPVDADENGGGDDGDDDERPGEDLLPRLASQAEDAAHSVLVDRPSRTLRAKTEPVVGAITAVVDDLVGH